MVRAYHLIMTAYGFWLPNDPRGSWSDFVGSWELFRYGKATTVNVRKSIASAMHDQLQRKAAKSALQHPSVRWTGVQARAIGQAFGTYASRAELAILACAILPDHVHLVTGRHRTSIEQVARQLKGVATRYLIAEGLHPMANCTTQNGRMPNMFARGKWAVYLNSDAQIHRAIRYVNENPPRDGLRPQRWTFVRPM